MRPTVCDTFVLGGTVIAVLLMHTGCSSCRGPLDTPTIVERTGRSIGTVVTYDARGKQLAQGTAFAVGRDEWIATNYHVIDGAAKAEAQFGSTTYPITGVLGYDKPRDLVLLQIDAPRFHPLRALPVAGPDSIKPGMEVIAIGSPLGLAHTVSTGTCSGTRVEGNPNRRLIQHTAAISPGSSGGPLLNRQGEVIGINTFFLKEGNSIFFAVSTTYLQALITDAADGATLKIADLPKLPEQQQDNEQNPPPPMGQWLTASAVREIGGSNESPQGRVRFYELIEGINAARTHVIADIPFEYHVKAFRRTNQDTTREFIAAGVNPSHSESDPEAPLRDGIRVHIEYPPALQVWKTENLAGPENAWIRKLRARFSFYSGAEATLFERDGGIGNMRPPELRWFVGQGAGADADVIYAYSKRSPACWVRMEMACPLEQRGVNMKTAWAALARSLSIDCLQEAQE